jgi:hypothetical protein
MGIYPVLTKEQLVSANNWAIEVGYNRALEPKPLQQHLDELPEDIKFPIVFDMPHSHAAGVEVEEHVRCQIVLDGNGSRAFIDMDLDLYNGLERLDLGGVEAE